MHSVTNILVKINWTVISERCTPKNFARLLSHVNTNYSHLEERKVLEDAAKQLEFKDISDWYKLTKKDMSKIVGKLAAKYKYTPILLLSSVYPEREWLPWKFNKIPKGFWDDISNQKRFMSWAAKQLNIREMSDWYKIKQQDFVSIGGGTLLERYNSSPTLLISALFPDYEWLPWKFIQVPKNYFDDLKNKRKFMDWASREIGIKGMEDWYKVTLKDLFSLGAGGLLQKHDNSVAKLLATTYPEFDWLPWKFEKNPKNLWSDKKTVRKFLDWAGKQLDVKEPNDWQKISIKDLTILGGGDALLYKYNYSLSHVLSLAYPDLKFGFQLTSYQYKKSQTLLKTMLKLIFSQEEVFEEYKHPDLVTPYGVKLELDLYYPKSNVAVEYQGSQHFSSLRRFSKSNVDEIERTDTLKRQLCKEKGITLIEVPYWWDRKYESLYATIYSQRPDLFTEFPTGQPIPLNPPNIDHRSKDESVEFTKKVLMTATEWNDETMEPTGWIMTEKYDGMRLYWNGSDFYSRQGNKIKVPESITSQMPKESLDGELWTQYGLYQESVALSKKGSEDKWKKAIFWVFDTTDIPDKPFEQRINYLKELKSQGKLPSFVNIVETVKCTGKQHLKEYFDSIIAKGGEGIMLREPQSFYKPGRSSSMRKFKPFFDTEVKVVENNYPHGFNCVQTNGKNLFVGLSDNYEEAKKVKKGCVITVKHQGVNVYGTLQYPKFYRERTDVKWEDLIKK